LLIKKVNDEVRKIIITTLEIRNGNMNQSQLARTLKIPRTSIIINTLNREGRVAAKKRGKPRQGNVSDEVKEFFIQELNCNADIRMLS
jgi:predicted transcriptional regulator